MRTAATVLLGAACVAAFIALFGVHAPLGYVTRPEAVTETARRSQLYDLVLRASRQVVIDDIRRTPGYRPEAEPAIVADVTAAMADVFPPDWFYDAFATGYGDITAILADRPREPTRIDLRGEKAQLAARLQTVVDARHRAAGARAVASLPDSIGLDTLVAGAGKDWLEPGSGARAELARAVAVAHIVRLAALTTLAVCLLLIVLLQHAPLSRLLVTLGVVGTLGAGLHLVAVHAADHVAGGYVEAKSLRTRAELQPRPDEIGDLAMQGAETMAKNFIHDALHHADATVFAILVTSLGATAAGLLLGRFRRSPRRQS